MSEENSRTSERVGEMLKAAYPLPDNSLFVTRDELDRRIDHVETKIEVGQLKVRNWIMAGALAILLTYGGGFVTLLVKLDQVATTPEVLAGRGRWMADVEMHEALQDREIQRHLPGYTPPPLPVRPD